MRRQHARGRCTNVALARLLILAATRTRLHHLHGAAREAERHRPHRALARPVGELVHLRHDELCRGWRAGQSSRPRPRTCSFATTIPRLPAAWYCYCTRYAPAPFLPFTSSWSRFSAARTRAGRANGTGVRSAFAMRRGHGAAGGPRRVPCTGADWCTLLNDAAGGADADAAAAARACVGAWDVSQAARGEVSQRTR